MDIDNQKRIERYADGILNCWNESNIDHIYEQKKLPWIKSFNLKAKDIAINLLLQH